MRCKKFHGMPMFGVCIKVFICVYGMCNSSVHVCVGQLHLKTDDLVILTNSIFT